MQDWRGEKRARESESGEGQNLARIKFGFPARL